MGTHGAVHKHDPCELEELDESIDATLAFSWAFSIAKCIGNKDENR